MVKYISLLYVGLTFNISPILTVVLSYFILGEKLKVMDLVLIGVILAGVTLIVVGYQDEYYKKHSHDKYDIPTVPSLWAVIMLIFIIFAISWGNILAHQLANLHSATCAVY